jgi:hypothetical protein
MNNPDHTTDTQGADSVQRMVRRIEELEDCLRTIERRLREDTAPILTLVRVYGGEETKRAWKEAIYSSAVRAQVMLHSPNNPSAGTGLAR